MIQIGLQALISFDSLAAFRLRRGCWTLRSWRPYCCDVIQEGGPASSLEASGAHHSELAPWARTVCCDAGAGVGCCVADAVGVPAVAGAPAVAGVPVVVVVVVAVVGSGGGAFEAVCGSRGVYHRTDYHDHSENRPV